MKYTATTLMSLLLLGVCSARILSTSRSHKMDITNRRDMDYWKPAQDPREGGQHEDTNSQQMVQLKDTIYQKLTSVYQQMVGNPYNAYLYLFEETPDFADPLTVGSTVDRHEMLIVNYDNVVFLGLNKSTSATLHIDTSSQTATLTLGLGKAEIQGHYNASDNNSGKFTIKMAGHLTYVSKFSYIMINDTYVQLMNATGELFYNSYISDYDNVGSYHPDIQKYLQFNLMLLVNERMHKETYAQYGDSIRRLIQDPNADDQPQEDSVEKVMRKNIINAVNGIQLAVSKHGVDSIELISADKETEYNKFHAKIASVRLNGIQKFYLAGNHISSENVDKIHAKVELAIDRPTATVVFSIHEVDNEDSPFQKINVDFDMEQLMANLLLDKSSRQSGLELHSVQTKINRIWPMGTEKFDGRINHLIKEKLTGHMKRYIEEGLKNFIRNELSFVMGRVSSTNNPNKMDNINDKNMNNWKAAQDYFQVGEQSKAEDQNSQQMVQLKDTIKQKLTSVYQQLGNPYNAYLRLSRNVPTLNDPLTIGSTVDRHGMLIINYDDVIFRGLGSFGPQGIYIDRNTRTAYVGIGLNQGEIQGHYNASDNNSGNFSINLGKFSAYNAIFPYVLINNTYPKLENTSGEFQYMSITSHYDNVGSYPIPTQDDLQINLWLLVNERVHQELHAKYSETIRQLIQNPESVERVRQRSINNAINEIQQAVSKHGVDSIDLITDDSEIVYNKLHAKIASVRLNGIQKVYLAGKHISTENVDKIQATLELAIDRPTATAVVSIREVNDENTSFKINVDFDMEQLMANLSLDKLSRQSGLKVRSVQTNINRIWPMGTEKFEGQVNNLIKEKLTGHMKRYIEESLKNFIQNELNQVISRGASQPSQEKWSARQM